ncbi:MAG: response regulator [Candidatus Cyclobacteriaceae bacterium M3_2C_046]
MKQYKVLIIDDDDLFLFVTKQSLNHLEMIEKLETAQDVSQARIILDQWKSSGDSDPLLLFIDFNLDEMNGIDFAHLFKKEYSLHFNETRLFILTSSIDRETKKKVMALPLIDDVLQKPLYEEKIKEILTL